MPRKKNDPAHNGAKKNDDIRSVAQRESTVQPTVKIVSSSPELRHTPTVTVSLPAGGLTRRGFALAVEAMRRYGLVLPPGTEQESFPAGQGWTMSPCGIEARVAQGLAREFADAIVGVMQTPGAVEVFTGSVDLATGEWVR